jgi:hypothetical protein
MQSAFTFLASYSTLCLLPSLCSLSLFNFGIHSLSSNCALIQPDESLIVMDLQVSYIVGPLLAAIVFNTFLFGTCVMQLISYIASEFKDRWIIRHNLNQSGIEI